VESWSLAVVAALLLAYAGVSHRLERTIVSAAMVFTAAGLLLGPEVLDWLHFDLGSSEVRILAEITLTLVLFLDASRIDVRSLRRELGFPARLLGIGLPLTIVAGTLAGALLFDELGWAEVLVLAIVLAPTDAALGLPVVTDMRLPSRVRQSLNVESGLNDGICVPLLFIALAIAEAEENAIGGGHAARIVAEEIGYGIVGGVTAGIAGALVLRLASKHGLADEIWAKVIPVTAAGLAYGIAAPLGGSGFIAAFVGGLMYGIVRGTVDLAAPESSSVMDAAAEVFAALTFIGFGSVALGWALHRLDWQVVVYAVLSLTAIRMVPVAISFIGSGAKRETVAYAGWFGPRGLASIVFAVLVIEESKLLHADLLITVSVITVAFSVVAHGVSALPLTNAYVRWFEGQRREPAPEGSPVHEHPWRRRLSAQQTRLS
jgi:NhaP-type Na+/H+ or K+/H+ antiporter